MNQKEYKKVKGHIYGKIKWRYNTKVSVKKNGGTLAYILIFIHTLYIIALALLKSIIPYCYYYKRVLILANIGDLVITVWARSMNSQTFMHSMSPTCMSTHAFPLPQTCPAQLHSFFVLLSVLSNYFPPIPLANAF